MIQNIIAMIWDFDKTLINGYMEEPIFKKYGIVGKNFWKEVNDVPAKYKKQNVRINEDTYYLNHMINYVKQGKFKDLNNQILYDLGKQLEFCSGLPEFLKELKDLVNSNGNYKKYDIKLEHYIVSTGLAQMVRGSEINDYVDGIWGCEFVEEDNDNGKKVISQVLYSIDNTSKTRAIFEINKGVNCHPQINVNSKMLEEDRRVPIKNMIYIADGPSDVPVFSVVKKNGGKTFAVYRKGLEEEFSQVDRLRRDGRIDMFGEANYTKETLTYMWLKMAVKGIADRIYKDKENEIMENISEPPKHITE